MSGPRPVRAPRGTELSTKGWLQEAALRSLMNNLDPEVAENPDELVVYGGRGKAARTWDAFDAIVDMLNAKYGLSLTGDDVGSLGQRVLKTERDFNARAGFTTADDRLPEFFKLEKLAPHNEVFDIPDAELDTVFDF